MLSSGRDRGECWMRTQLRQPMGRTPQMLSMRALVTVVATVTLLIAGLLGMHALGGSMGHAPGRSGAEPAAVAEHATAGMATQHAYDADAAAASKAAHCPTVCEDEASAPPACAAEFMACVLALLAGLLLLVPPGSVGRTWLTPVARTIRTDASAVLLVPPPPSLTLLSISRT